MEPNFMEELDENIKRIDHKEEILGKDYVSLLLTVIQVLGN